VVFFNAIYHFQVENCEYRDSFTKETVSIPFFSHIACPVASKHAINSAYVMDDATIDCLQLLHEIAPHARVNTYPDVDFLSSSA
jgi:hypothetical protein